MALLRSAFDYSRYMVRALGDPDIRAMLKAQRSLPALHTLDKATINAALQDVAGYFERAQDHGADDGLGSYHLIHGWGASYPETTGYIIPTLLRLSVHLKRPELEQRAMRAAEWLLSIQGPEGAWQGGRVGEGRGPIVFNTAQVVRGMLAAYANVPDPRFRDAAMNACAWIIAVQEEDGSWAEHNFLGASRTYDTYVAAPLLAMQEHVPGDTFIEAAERAVRWVLSRQHPNGWFEDCDNTIAHNDRPITHTVAYTIDGLIECYERIGRQVYLDAAVLSMEGILENADARKGLAGRFDHEWKGSELPIPTGCAQLAVCCHRLWRSTNDEKFRMGMIDLTSWLMAVHATTLLGPEQARGAMPGSFPLWGRYEKFAFPNWATKYFADALLCAHSALE